MHFPAHWSSAGSHGALTGRPVLGSSTHTLVLGSHARPAHCSSEPHVGTQASAPPTALHARSGLPWHLTGSSASSTAVSGGLPRSQRSRHLLPSPPGRHAPPPQSTSLSQSRVQ